MRFCAEGAQKNASLLLLLAAHAAHFTTSHIAALKGFFLLVGDGIG